MNQIKSIPPNTTHECRMQTVTGNFQFFCKNENCPDDHCDVWDNNQSRWVKSIVLNEELADDMLFEALK